MATGPRKDGEFCWINMLTPRPDEARDFFGRVLGWTYVEMPGMGHLVQVGGRNIGGLFDVVSPQTPQGTPPVIGVMMKVASADATGEKVKALGGQAQPAFDIMDQGRMAVCHDPNGANFDIWEGKKSPGTDADSTHPGAPSWFETRTTDAERATAFYSALFGWTPEPMPLPDLKYTTFKKDGTYIAGALPLAAGAGATRSHWATYFTVTDADRTTREAATLGATVALPVEDVPGVGRCGGLTSPQGVTFYVVAYAT